MSPAPLQLHRHTLRVEPDGGIDGVLDALAELRRASAPASGAADEAFVAVNVISPSTTQPMLFCGANLQAVLAPCAGALRLDLAPAGQYASFAAATLDAASCAVGECRRALTRTPVPDCGRQLADLRQRLDLVLLLVDGLALQRRDAVLADSGHRLGACIRQLAGSAREADVVRCMDDLQYECLPALGAIHAAIRR